MSVAVKGFLVNAHADDFNDEDGCIGDFHHVDDARFQVGDALFNTCRLNDL